MAYRLMGRMHATLLSLGSSRGQGTVEYVGLILLIAGVIAAVVAFGATVRGDGIGGVVVKKLQNAIEGVGSASGAGGGSPNGG
jgi:hypothetical protein